MFQTLASILTMSAMLLHSILGCCSHHAHACEHGHSVETCPADHDAHGDDAADTQHVHEHLAPADAEPCGHGGEESDECPHQPCQHNCDGSDCHFNQTVKVKTPTPDDVGEGFSAAFASVLLTPTAGHCPARSADTGPPGLSAACCCRPMMQVWQL